MKISILAILAFFLTIPALAGDDPTVYVTKSGSKYHAAGCSSLSRSSIPMKLSEAVEKYDPCSRCKPSLSSGSAATQARQSTPSQSGTSVGTTSKGQTIYTGPRGGRYHYSKSGKKVYERKRR